VLRHEKSKAAVCPQTRVKPCRSTRPPSREPTRNGAFTKGLVCCEGMGARRGCSGWLGRKGQRTASSMHQIVAPTQVHTSGASCAHSKSLRACQGLCRTDSHGVPSPAAYHCSGVLAQMWRRTTSTWAAMHCQSAVTFELPGTSEQGSRGSADGFCCGVSLVWPLGSHGSHPP
jgi:hypothetical protein